MNFNQMKVGKKGMSNVLGPFMELLLTIAVVGIMSVVVITLIVIFGPMVSDKATAAAEAAEAANKSAIASLWNIVGTEGLFEIMAISTYVILVLVIMAAIIINAAKKLK